MQNNKYKNESQKINAKHIRYKTEELLNISSNRYKVTVQIANRAKRKNMKILILLMIH